MWINGVYFSIWREQDYIFWTKRFLPVSQEYFGRKRIFLEKLVTQSDSPSRRVNVWSVSLSSVLCAKLVVHCVRLYSMCALVLSKMMYPPSDGPFGWFLAVSSVCSHSVRSGAGQFISSYGF